MPTQDWCIVYTSSRDSDLADESNHAFIEKALEPFCEYIADGSDCDSVRHGHWAVGWVEGYAIRIRKEGAFTPVFLKWAEIAFALSNYPLLDEDDHYRRENEAAFNNTVEVARRVASKLDAMSFDAEKIYQWLRDNEESEIENRDGHGGYPSYEAVERAMLDIGYVSHEDEDA